MQLYIIEKNINANFAFYSVSLINGLGVPARILVGLFAQKFGLWNLSTFVATVMAIGGWAILGLNSTGPLVVVCIIYGIALGGTLSLNVSIAGQLAKTPEEVGARLGIALFIPSAFLLVSSPVQGALLTSEFHWNRPIIFSAVMATAAAGFFFVGRLYVVKQRGTWIV